MYNQTKVKVARPFPGDIHALRKIKSLYEANEKGHALEGRANVASMEMHIDFNAVSEKKKKKIPAPSLRSEIARACRVWGITA